MNIEDYNCIEGDHKIKPEFSNDGAKGIVRCITCGLVYMDSEDPEYSMRFMIELRMHNLIKVTNE